MPPAATLPNARLPRAPRLRPGAGGPFFDQKGLASMIKKVFDNFEELLGSVILVVMAVITFANVVTRYFIFYALAFTEEVTINLFVWLVMLGTAIAFKKGANLSMTFVYDKLPARGRKFCFFASTALSLAFFGLLGYLGYVQVADEIALSVTSSSLAIPVWWYTISLPVFSALIFIRILQAAIETVRGDVFQGGC